MKRISLSVLLCLLSFARPASAFYEHDADDRSIHARALFAMHASAYQYPDHPALFPQRELAVIAPSARVIASGRFGPGAALDINLFANYAHTSWDASRGAGIDRSGALEWTLSDTPRGHGTAGVDHLFFTLTADRFDLRVGRQPVNLATCFYFTPNDIFAPFTASEFYREYKPGVDAVRLDARTGSLSQLSLIHVRGYTADASTANGASAAPDGKHTTIARASATFAGFEWALLGGTLQGATLAGASLQGEIFQWLGIRAEGHRRRIGDLSQDLISWGVEHRFPSSLSLRYEHFHNGAGSDLAAVSFSDTHPGREYGALGATYEFTPLFSGQALLQTNWRDNSKLLSLYGTYSLSDESEISFGAGIPFGDRPDGFMIRSEYGAAPYSASIDFREYF